MQAIRTAALEISGSQTYNTSSYTWAPVIDGSFLTQSLSQATIKGQVNTEFGFGFYNTHEGRSPLGPNTDIYALKTSEGQNFIPPGLANPVNTGSPPFNSSIPSFESWLKGFLPSFSDRDIQRILSIYPEIGSSESIPTYNTSYTRAGLIYRDVVLACPAYWTARAASKKSWVGEYTISYVKISRTKSSDIEQFGLETSLPLTPFTYYTAVFLRHEPQPSSSFLFTDHAN